MTARLLERRTAGSRWGFKGPQAGDWLAAQGLALPAAPNTVATGAAGNLLIARLGSAEFFIESEDGALGAELAQKLAVPPSGVYPVLREDWAFALAGADVHEVLAQVCNVNFAALALEPVPVIMTLMVGVAVLVVPQAAPSGARRYRIWCDPTFGPYLSEALGAVVVESGE
jgi:sarcosine oxidase subunit gamma